MRLIQAMAEVDRKKKDASQKVGSYAKLGFAFTAIFFPGTVQHISAQVTQ